MACLLFWGLVVLRVADEGQRRRRFVLVHADFSAAVSIFVCLLTSRRARPLAAAHIASGAANTKDIPPLSKSFLEDRLENVAFPMRSQLSDGVLQSKPSLADWRSLISLLFINMYNY